ncbi:hypothetical protein CEXT_615291, partial [Caerostris extrusa]
FLRFYFAGGNRDGVAVAPLYLVAVVHNAAILLAGRDLALCFRSDFGRVKKSQIAEIEIN